MARNKDRAPVLDESTDASAGQAQVEGGASGAPPYANPALSDPAAVTGSAVGMTPEPDASTRYRVENGGYINGTNGKTFLHAGKLVDDRQYDVEHLRSQGIILKRIEAPASEVA